ncbi:MULTISPECIES: 3-oxo-tetronate 4-phosphate decarboxylase [Ensifer]|jgi:ribulose-5-phosphate 4-epimerase/fuculose-1-phosphate aldolase|uniref:3-oxo-tetronate 4-phosphate decarboxylase n=1 Tax=Ensifer TaxID=106591 RepID=UPI00071505DC|nr:MULTISPECIES: 3-oxo-tetronate 4-phosphate decarboxylase [Ensifer]KQX51331.1 aldolase [Ensifer sp. Root1298]KQX83696.1 aldolase [Ensifer sp. Root1312]KRC20041.1 aldolase [Ensifer sp. Root74]KRD63288.1 aldolase [Ensifer sp. Root954]
MTAIVSEETRTRDSIAKAGKSIFDRGLTSGSTGNISVRLSDSRMLMTPTNASLGMLEPERLSLFSAEGVHVGGDKPTKEAFLHKCMYCAGKARSAVVHLHSTYSVAASILMDVDERDVLPPLTAYYVMRVGTLPLVPYYPPGDEALAAAVGAAAEKHHAILMANHGPVVAGKTLEDAQYAIEELEETAKLFLLLQNRDVRPLTADQKEALLDRSK